MTKRKTKKIPESKSGPVDRGFHLSYTCDVGFPLGEDLKP